MITTTCREHSATRDDPTAEAKGVLGDNTIFGPVHDAQNTLHYGRYSIEVQIDSVRGDGTKLWVVISRGVDRYVTEMSAGCKQFVHPETVALKDASSSTECLVADMEFVTKSIVKVPFERSVEPNSPLVKVQGQNPNKGSSNERIFGEIHAVQTGNFCSQKYQTRLPKEDREWNFITFVMYPPARSLHISA